MIEYLPLLVVLGLSTAFVAVTLLAARLLRHPGAVADAAPYECGNESSTRALERPFSPRYYLVAVLFVIFEVETVFLFPWAVMLDRLTLFGLIEMFVFLGILVFGYLYAWRRKAFEWS